MCYDCFEVENVALTWEEAERRVELGALFLTDELGEGWAERIDLNRLNIGSSLDCIAGQLFSPGQLDHGFHVTGWSIFRERYPAIDIPGMGFDCLHMDDIGTLNTAWKYKILSLIS